MNKVIVILFTLIPCLALSQVSLSTGDHFWYKKSAGGPNEIFKPSADVQSLLDDSSVTNMRTSLGLAIGTDVQAYDAGLASIAGLTTAANKGIYTTGSDTYATYDLTTQGRQLLDDTSFSAMRTTLELGSSNSVSFGTLTIQGINYGHSTYTGAIVRGDGTDDWVFTPGTSTSGIVSVSFPPNDGGRIPVVDDSLGRVDLSDTDEVTGNLANAQLANMDEATIKGREASSGTGSPVDLTAAQVRTIINVEDGADVTDATNVDAAGAVMNADTSTASMDFVVDEDDMASNSATKVPTQQSVKAYADAAMRFPRGHRYGLNISNNVTDASNDIDIATGECVDSTGAYKLVLGSALTKRLDASWAVGTGNGGLDTGSIANTTYHVFLIKRSDTGVVDALFSTSATAPTMPASYDSFRRIGSIIRSAGAILGFIKIKNRYFWTSVYTDRSSTATTTDALLTLTVPSGIKVAPKLVCYLALGASSDAWFKMGNGFNSGADTFVIRCTNSPASGNQRVYSVVDCIVTNTNGQIRFTADTSSGSIATGQVNTHGFTDLEE